MSSQFKTFLKFTLLAAAFIATPIIADKFGKDFGLLVIPEIVIFLALVWYKIFYLNSKNNISTAMAQNNLATAGSTEASFSVQKQLISSLTITFIIFLIFLFLGYFIISFFLNSFILNFPPLVQPIRIAALVFFVYAIIRWISAIKYSIKVRENEIARKAANKQIIILASIISVLACLMLASLGPWGLLLLLA